MEFLKKNKIIVGIVVIILIAAGLWFFVISKGGGNMTDGTGSEDAQNVKQIDPDEIGLTLSLKPDGRAVIMKVTKLDGIKTLEYELSYDAEETVEGETAVVPKGAVGSPIDVAGESEIEREILLGTCSANKCRYDVVKSDIKIIVKVIYENGDVASVEDVLPYESE